MEYLMTVRMKFEAVDDMDARQEANRRIDEASRDHGGLLDSTGAEVKLQRLRKDGSPEKVEL